MPGALVEFQAVSLGYGRRPVLQGLTFSIERGQLFAFIGPNGAGKTTLLRAVAGILPPAAGRLLRHGPPAVGYVPQERALDPVFPLSALDVVLQGRLGRRAGRRPGADDHAAAAEALAQADVVGLGSARFHTLSGGQKQRVLIARALASQPTVLVLDEPTSGMDAAAERDVLDLLRRLQAEGGLTVVLASHDLAAVGNYAGRIAVVDRERGLFEVGTDAEMLTDERLSRLYRRPVRVRQVDGWRTILVGGAA
ncbi:MAG TPA: metal ABC transporter ATP-binding protein [Methylomirabilota bacterium]|nr:metal ABC transporter ATP-binding protein [Methylomirabilota bacterium]